MAMYMDEEEIWKCPKHPSKRRRSNGVCPVCLKDRLVILCPDCANVRPCACYASSSSSSSSASSSFSLFSVRSGSAATAGGCGGDGAGSVGRVSSLIDSEPAFRRSRSVGIPFLRSSFKNSGDRKIHPNKSSKTSSFWSVFKFTKGKRNGEAELRERGMFYVSGCPGDFSSEDNSTRIEDTRIEDFARMMMRSRSMSVAITSVSGDDVSKSPSGKSKGWHFPSPLKVFRQSKASKLVYERSPLYRG